jgi:hypothetical protein
MMRERAFRLDIFVRSRIWYDSDCNEAQIEYINEINGTPVHCHPTRAWMVPVRVLRIQPTQL